MGTAALVAAWQRRQPRGRWLLPTGIPRGSLPAADPAGPIGLKVEAYIGSGWEDISAYVLYRDAQTLISTVRGRPDEASRTPPQTCSLQVNNRDSRFSPRNPSGPYFGLLGRNTPIRVSRLWNGERFYRFHGEVPEWPSDADISGTDVYVPVQPTGMLRRLQQGTPPVVSAMRRDMTNPARVGEQNVVAYWPLEDGANATQYASAISGASAMLATASGAVSASDSSWLASLPLPAMNGGVLQGSVSSYTNTGQTNLRWNMIIPGGGLGATRNIISMYGTGTVRQWLIQVDAAGDVILTAFDTSNTVVLNTTILDAVNGKNMAMGVQLTKAGANITWNVLAIDVASYSWALGLITLSAGGTLTGQTVGMINQVVVGDSAGLGATAIGHVAVGNLIAAFTSTGLAMGANAGEPVFSADAFSVSGGASTAGRFIRLCGELGVNGAEVYGTAYSGDTVTMGAQLPDSYPNLLAQCADTGLNMLYEARDQLSLVLRSRLSLYNQAPRLTLDCASNQLSAQPVPKDDDYYTRNDVTVARVGGSSAVAQQQTGALNTQNPPAPGGVGDYASTDTISLGDDLQLADQAGWRLHMGTVDEPRYPSVSLNLRHPQFTSNVALMNAALSLEIGDRIVINNPPARLGADPLSLIVQGYSDSMGVFEHEMVINTSPESPYRIAILDDPVLGHADTDGSTLAAPLGPILNSNPLLAGGSSSGWSVFNGSMAVVGTSGSASPLPAGGPAGYGLLLTANGGTFPNVFEAAAANTSFPAVAGQTYLVSALVYYPSALNQVFITVNFYDSSFVFIATSNTAFTVAANTWTAISSSFAAPAGAAYGAPAVGLSGASTNGDTLYVANAVVWQGAVSVATTGAQPGSPLWTTSAADFPFDIAAGGERMTVTSVSGASPPQAFTVARAVDGVLKPQSAGTDVRLWQPMILSL